MMAFTRRKRFARRKRTSLKRRFKTNRRPIRTRLRRSTKRSTGEHYVTFEEDQLATLNVPGDGSSGVAQITRFDPVDFPRFSSLLGLFKWYRITWARVTYSPRFNTINMFNASGASSGVAVTYIDRDALNVAAPSVSTALARPLPRKHSLGRPIVRVWKPNTVIVRTLQSDGAGATIPLPAQNFGFIPTSSGGGTVDHIGVGILLPSITRDNPVPAAPISNFQWDIRIKIRAEFKGRKFT